MMACGAEMISSGSCKARWCDLFEMYALRIIRINVDKMQRVAIKRLITKIALQSMLHENKLGVF